MESHGYLVSKESVGWTDCWVPLCSVNLLLWSCQEKDGFSSRIRKMSVIGCNLLQSSHWDGLAKKPSLFLLTATLILVILCYASLAKPVYTSFWQHSLYSNIWIYFIRCWLGRGNSDDNFLSSVDFVCSYSNLLNFILSLFLSFYCWRVSGKHHCILIGSLGALRHYYAFLSSSVRSHSSRPRAGKLHGPNPACCLFL
jgi:hypothetical protein